jgi:hypothetical protein
MTVSLAAAISQQRSLDEEVEGMERRSNPIPVSLQLIGLCFQEQCLKGAIEFALARHHERQLGGLKAPFALIGLECSELPVQLGRDVGCCLISGRLSLPDSPSVNRALTAL